MRRALTYLSIVSLVGSMLPAQSGGSRDGGSRDLDLARLERIDPAFPESVATPIPLRVGNRTRGWVTRIAGVQVASGDDQALLLPVPAPAVDEGRVYAGGGFYGRELSALDLRSGKELWRTHLEDNGPSTPSVSRRSVVVNTESCTTFRLDPVSGSPRWKRHLGPNIQGNPTVAGERVYTAARLEQGAHALFALSHDTGEVLWQAPLDRDVFGEPVAFGERVFATTQSRQVVCLADDGQLAWKVDVAANAAPWVDRDGVYVAYSDARLLELRRLDPRTGEVVWEAKPSLSNAEERPGEPLVTTSQARRFPRIRPWGWGDEPPRPVGLGTASCSPWGGTCSCSTRAAGPWNATSGCPRTTRSTPRRPCAATTWCSRRSTAWSSSSIRARVAWCARWTSGCA